MFLAGCGMTYSRLEVPAETSASARNSAATYVQVGPVVIPHITQAAEKLSPNADCASAVQRLTTSLGDYAAVALHRDCPATTDTPQNGDHGFYPKPPPTAKTEQVETPVGTATLFTNQYSECTSSCYIGGDEVALVTVDDSVVQITAVTSPASGTTSRSRADLVQLLQSLRHV